MQMTGGWGPAGVGGHGILFPALPPCKVLQVSREGIRTSPSEGQRVPILLAACHGRLLVSRTMRSGSVCGLT